MRRIFFVCGFDAGGDGRRSNVLQQRDTALTLAARYGRIDCVRLLVELGTNMKVMDRVR